MDLGMLLAILVISILVPCLLAREDNQTQNISCPKDFQCGKLGRLSFPFTNISQPADCGLCQVYCDNRPLPKIRLSWVSDQSFDVISVSQNSSIIKLKDPVLQNLLVNNSCNTFYYDIKLPDSPISFTSLLNITLYRCSIFPRLSQEVVDQFYSQGYKPYELCEGFRIYYRNPKYHHSQSEFYPLGCSALNLPMRPRNNVSKESELFELLAGEFDLQWHLSDAGNSSKTIILIVAAIAGGAVLIIALAIFLWRCKNRTEDAQFLCSRRDLEGGNTYLGVPIFSYTELEEITNNFDASKELGDGGYGTVYYGKLRDGREVAVKRLYQHNFKRMEQFMNEIQILTRLKHKNLVSLYGCTSRHSRELLLVYEFVPNGTVADHLHGERAKQKSLPWPVRMKIAIQTASALAYLHASDIIHRDVKTNNILLDHNFQVKVADFGLSRLFPNDVSHISTAPQGTPGYVDPEYHYCYQLTDRSDVYSFGVVLIELVSSMPAVDTSRNRHEINLATFAVNRIQRCAFNELIDPSLGFESDFEVLRMTTSVAELAFRCLQLEKEMRPTMNEVLETLKAIQDCKEIFEETKGTNANTIESRSTMLPSSPESENVVLLKKDTRIPSSPKSVTDLCISGSTTSSKSR